jgi:xanthine dehydrogenase small subunit
LLLSLDASISIESFNTKTILSLKDFFISYRKTKLKKGQFISSIRIPIYKKNIFKAFKISKRIDDDISSVCASFNVAIVNKKIKNIKIAYGGMAPIPKRAIHCEKILLNSDFSEEVILKAQISLETDFQPISDMRASKNYRMEIAKNLLLKCFTEIKNNKSIRLNH